MKENPIQQRIRLDAAYNGSDLWRNNNGACIDETGRLIRYGLANESAELNSRIKSSDLIGLTPTLIQPHHVGCIVGVFTAIECKKSDWHMTPGDERAIAQAAFHDIVRRGGGYAGFARSVEEYRRIVFK